MRIILCTVTFLATSALLSPALAQSGETPPTLDGAKTTSTSDVKSMVGKAMILDVRKKATYLDGRLPGAKSIISFYDADKKSYDVTAAFGTDKAAPIVIYGHGSDGWSAVTAVKAAVGAGYINVHWMRTGWAAWSAEKLPTEQ
jgi:rhodanese-related sulfurtransferase